MHPGGPAFGVVSLQGVCIQGSWADPPTPSLPTGGGGLGRPPPPEIRGILRYRSTSGQYACYWNAFFFEFKF